MGERGPHPKSNISTQWSASLAYAIGLLVSDGCLYNDGRHISLTTKDIEQAENFKKCLGLDVVIGNKSNGASKEKKYYHVQFGNVLFYNFLLSIGLMPAKSKIISTITLPDKYFFDYLRGYFDGDGCFYSYWDTRWKSSHMFYLEFVSASEKYIYWLKSKIENACGVQGHEIKSKKKDIFKVRYAKREALEIIKEMYYSHDVVCLPRKRLKIKNALGIELVRIKSILDKKKAQVEKLVDSHP